MILTQTVAPTADPVLLEEVRDHCRVTSHAEDAVMARYLKAAVRYAEERTRRQLITATWKLNQDILGGAWIVLPRPPLQSVTSVKYYDSAGVQQTMSSGDYTVDTASDPGRIVLNYNTTWPGDQRGHVNDAEIIYVAGYGAVSTNVIETIRQAIILLAAQWFENREPWIAGTIGTNVPFAVDQLLWNERCNGFG